MSKTVYFPGINGIRAIAAFSVIIAHIEVYKSLAGAPALLPAVLVHQLGHKGLSLFFVLSGFLISYLLLEELNQTSDIKLKKFYIRRILRIWPLYYLVVSVSFVILPHLLTFEPWNDRFVSQYYIQLLFYFFMLPNFIYSIGGPIPFVSVLWSIGVEEQFYLSWPVLLKKIKKNPVIIFVVIILTLIAFNVLFYISSFIFTILVASVSYFYFEKFFLEYKKKFAVIESTN